MFKQRLISPIISKYQYAIFINETSLKEFSLPDTFYIMEE